MTDIPHVPLLMLILLLAGLYVFSSWLLLSAIKPEAAHGRGWWLVFGPCLCALFLAMALFNLPLPLFFLLLYGFKICQLLRFPEPSQRNWIAVNEGFLYTCATCLVILGALSFLMGLNVRVMLSDALLRGISLTILLVCNLVTELVLSRRPHTVSAFSDLYGSEESILFVQFTFLAVLFVLADAAACLFELPTAMVSLFLVGSNLLLLLMVSFFLNQLGIIKREGYLEQEHTLLTSTMHQQSERTEALRDTAYRDPLTGAFTRLYALDYLSLLLSRRTSFSLVYMDLDGLKGINDTYGHLAGDHYLQDFVTHLQEHLRGEDILARMGGDEFMLLMPDLPAAAANSRLQDSRCQLETEFRKNWPLSFSFGVVEAAAPCEKSPEDLIREADQCMYRDKAARHTKEVQL